MAGKTNWADNFNKLVEVQYDKVDSNKYWVFALEENKKSGTLNINFREWQNPTEKNEYNGPTKNGFVQGIRSKEDFDEFKKNILKFFEEAEKMF